MDPNNTDQACHVRCEKEHENENKSESLGSTLFCYMKKYKKNILQYIADTDETDTYEQVLFRSIRTALKLRDKGIKRNDIISMCTYNHKNSCVPLIATLLLGAIPASFDPTLPHLDTIHLLKLMEPKIIFVSPESVSFMEKCVAESKTKTEIVVFGDSTKYEEFDEYLVPHSEEENFKPGTVDDNDTAIVMFSSGTTGLPKGICLSHKALVGILKSINIFALENEGKQSVGMLYTTFYWISGVSFLIKTVANGKAWVVCSKFDAYKAWNIIEKYKVTVVFLAPHLANELVHNRPKDADVSSLRLLLTGGSTVTKKLMDDLNSALPNTTILQAYGQTEVATCVCFFDSTNPEDVEMQIRKPLSCGKIQPEFLWKVVDPETENVMGPNEKGELRLKFDLLMNGYYKMDTSSAYDSEGYLKTGDIVYFDDEGCFFIVDRIKEMFKYKGWHILPVILESILMTHSAVKEAAVIGIPHDIDGDHPMGIVVLYDEFTHVTPRDIELFVQEKVPEIQRLRAGVKIVKELARTATGKVKRSTLKKMVLDGKI